jgi:hypothetical protein
MGEGMIASHGSREMPVCGPIFHQVRVDVDRGPVRPERPGGMFSKSTAPYTATLIPRRD